MELKREHQINFWYIVTALWGIVLIQSLLAQPTHQKTIPYSEFLQLVKDNKITDLVVGPNSVTGTYKQPQGEIPHFTTVRVDPQLAADLAGQKMSFAGEPPAGLLQTLLSWFVSTLGFILLWMFLVRPMAGGMGA